MDGAIADYTKAIELKPDFADAYNHRRLAAGDKPNIYTLEYVHSDRKWMCGIVPPCTDRYDQISENFQDQMVAPMERYGFERATSSEGACCKLTVEILKVEAVDLFLSSKDPGVIVTANVKFTDNNGHLVYTKEYRGEARVPPGLIESKRKVMHSAIGDMVKNISGDVYYNAHPANAR